MTSESVQGGFCSCPCGLVVVHGVWLWHATVGLLHFHLHFFKLSCMCTHMHTHIASGLTAPCFHLIYLWALPLPIKEGGQWRADLRLGLFMASFLSKQKIIQLMCVIHIFPFADPGRGVEIKASFLFYRAVELKSDADQLSGFSEGLLTGHEPIEGERQISRHSTSQGQSGCCKSHQILLFFCGGTDDMVHHYKDGVL